MQAKNRPSYDVLLSATANENLTPVIKRKRGHVSDPVIDHIKDSVKANNALDARMLSALQTQHGVNTLLKLQRLNDLRRTAATQLVEIINVQSHIIDAMLNHISGHKAGVGGIYNGATCSIEKRAELNAWARLVIASVN